MNCFEWQNHASEYVDGLLIGAERDRAERHLNSCEDCGRRFSHYRTLLDSISSQPRSTLPIPIRRAPFSSSVARPRLAHIRRHGGISAYFRSYWHRVPWYLRTSLEGLSIVMVIILGISTAPKIRRIYEKSIEKSLNEFNDPSDPRSDEEKAADGLPQAQHIATTGAANAVATNSAVDDYAGGETGEDSGDDEGDDEVSAAPDKSGDMRVGHDEIWRFNVKTDSPSEFRAKIIEILAGLKVQKPGDPTVNIEGIEAPGGIQFDMLLPQGVVSDLKKSIEKIAPQPGEAIAQITRGEAFTWYKNRSKTRLPAGKTRVVIWLSQI